MSSRSISRTADNHRLVPHTFIVGHRTQFGIHLQGTCCRCSPSRPNEVKRPEFADLGASFAQMSSEATRRLCEQSQSASATGNVDRREDEGTPKFSCCRSW